MYELEVALGALSAGKLSDNCFFNFIITSENIEIQCITI